MVGRPPDLAKLLPFDTEMFSSSGDHIALLSASAASLGKFYRLSKY